MTRTRRVAFGLGLAAALFTMGASAGTAEAGRGCRSYRVRTYHCAPPVVYYRPAPVIYSYPVYAPAYCYPSRGFHFSYSRGYPYRSGRVVVGW